MHIQAKVYYVGVNDRVKHRFEGLWNLPQGVSYNSYLIADEEAVALVDTVDVAFFAEYLAHIRAIIGERPINYLIINHMKPTTLVPLALSRNITPKLNWWAIKRRSTWCRVSMAQLLPTM